MFPKRLPFRQLPINSFRQFQLREGAYFISDLHWRPGDPSLFQLLEVVERERPPQLILVGDIFQLLLNFPVLVEWHREGIEALREVARQVELYYLEGNHDFGIEPLFPEGVVARGLVDRERQVVIHHGDWGEKFSYCWYRFWIRRRWVQRLLHYTSGNWRRGEVFKRILQKRVKCPEKVEWGRILPRKRWDGVLVEGHYHSAGEVLQWNHQTYVALPSYYCHRKIGIFDKNQFYFRKIN